MEQDRRIGTVMTSLGACRATICGENLVELHISAEEVAPGSEAQGAEFRRVAEAVDRYAAGDFAAVGALALGPEGTPFQRKVWEALRALPAGRTVSYSELAEICGAPKGVRAAASAVAANRIALAIPCHRVVRKGGEVGQFRWGSELKAKLIELERSAATRRAIAA